MSVVETERTGIISEFYDSDTGSIKEDGTSAMFEFARMGAQVEFEINEKIIFVTITTPNGRKIVKELIKRG